MKKTRETIRRRSISSLSDEERWDILQRYKTNQPVQGIADDLNVSRDQLSSFIQSNLKDMLIVRETNELQNLTYKGPTSVTKCLTQEFVEKVEEVMDVYAYYFIQTGDNEFAIKECGLDIGIPKTMKVTQKRNVYRIRGQYVRDIPAVAKYIRTEQDRRMQEMNVDKLYVQRELVNQIEEMKMLATEDQRVRTGLTKNLELLGKTIGAFTDRVEVDEGNAKSGLDLLMEKIKEAEPYEESPEDDNDE